MDKEQKLAICKLAYREIMDVIEKYEVRYQPYFSAHWDECISFHDEFFQRKELNE